MWYLRLPRLILAAGIGISLSVCLDRAQFRERGIVHHVGAHLFLHALGTGHIDNEDHIRVKAQQILLSNGVEDIFAPDKETVLMMEPDLIFSWGSLFSDKNLGNQPEWISNGTNTYISTGDCDRIVAVFRLGRFVVRLTGLLGIALF